MLAVIEAPILFLFQSLVKQMFFVIAEVVLKGVIQEDHLIYTPINMKRSNFINNRQMSWRYFFSFDQNLNSPKYSA